MTDTIIKQYTLGFIFDMPLYNVLLIRKERPDWQRGRLNGIGGKVELNERSERCIVREVAEECGLVTSEQDWTKIGNMHGNMWSVDIYAYVHAGDASEAYSVGDEEIGWYQISKLPDNVLTNIPWLIQLSLDKIKNNKFENCVVRYA